MTITRKRFTHTLLPALLAAFAGFAACSSDDDAPEPPKPSGYDIYTAGYTTPASKAVATVWKNGQLLYTLTDGTNDAWAYAVCVSDGTVYAAGYERQGDRIVAAKCILPVTQSDVPKSFGTRHRAAIGMSEISDAIIVVVSEETGDISIAQGGEIRLNIDPVRLQQTLQRYLTINTRKRSKKEVAE
jgi:hypothetical protein